MSKNEKPTTAFVLSLIAGILILLGGVMSLVLNIFMRGIFGRWPSMMGDEWPGMMMGWWSGVGTVLSIVGVVIGFIVILSAIMLNSRPKDHAAWGTLILIFSIISFIGAWAGFGVGLILGIIGGALAIGWKPSTTVPQAAIKATGRFCIQCGRAISVEAKFCPHCGKELPT